MSETRKPSVQCQAWSTNAAGDLVQCEKQAVGVKWRIPMCSDCKHPHAGIVTRARPQEKAK